MGLRTTIDPTTGQIPLDPSIGFLPPDNSAGVGEGFVSYTVMANRRRPPATPWSSTPRLRSISTPSRRSTPPQIFNTLDAGTELTSTVAAPAGRAEFANVQCLLGGGQPDNPAGSAVADYTIYVSDDSGPFVAVAPGHDPHLHPLRRPARRAQHVLTFYSVADDNTGNEQSAPGPVVTTTIQSVGGTTGISNVSSGTGNGAYGVGANMLTST